MYSLSRSQIRTFLCAAVALAWSTGSLPAQEKGQIPAAPPGGKRVTGNRQSELQPGPVSQAPVSKNPFQGDERAIGEGKRLFAQFNCAGCHAAGGGAIGPPLMDDEWIYGSSPANIYWTIVEGRPQGMPAYGGRIVEHQLWWIVAYVRSLSGLDKKSTAQMEQPANAARTNDDPVARGKQVFLNGPCAMCHTIAGTLAQSRVGPDLTHLAERKTIAAGTLPNTRGHLAGWILNPQNLKPGTLMPPTPLEPDQLHSLLSYLQTLK